MIAQLGLFCLGLSLPNSTAAEWFFMFPGLQFDGRVTHFVFHMYREEK